MNLFSGLRIILPAVFLFVMMETFAQDDFYDINTIQEIEISFSQSNWDYILDTTKAGSGSYLMSQWVKINGVQYDSAGVKYKGSSSYDPSFNKNPLHISLDEFKNQSHLGYTSIKLANFYGDPSMIREPLAYNVLANYMDCPKSNFAKVTINGAYIGLYANDESINKKFCSTHFYSSGNTFIKGSPILPGPFSKSNLKYISADSSSYFGKYELESEYGWNDLAELCDIITNLPSVLSITLDIDRVLWMLAFNNVLVNLDSYSGWFAQNHYLYKDNTGHFNPVIWDLNMSFGGFPFAGTQNGGSGALTVNDMKQMDPLLHDAHSDWPLIMTILSNPQWKRMYLAHMKTIVYENFYFGNYLEQAEMMQTLIDQSVLTDANKFFTYEQFQQGLWTDVTFGSYVIPAIDGLMAERSGFLQSTDVFPDNTVLFGGVWTEEQFPEPGQVVNMMANVVTLTGEGDLRVYLGVRHDKEEKFVLNEMFDDGNHNDGEAGDHVYGASFTMTTLTAQYYAYAEIDEANNFSACFSPERAEHEFYTLNAVVPTAQPGDVAINEFLAKNTSDTTNEYGNYEDWIEIYNLTGEPVDLFGLYLTDDFDNRDKYAFPENTIIAPGGFLTIWADEEDTVSSILHANFKLSADGEDLMISNGADLVIDSLTFGAQTADISWGRCPNGSGLFDYLDIPTFGQENYCPEFISEKGNERQEIKVIPNPFQDNFSVEYDNQDIVSAELCTISGLIIAKVSPDVGKIRFSTNGLLPGIYFILLRNDKNEVTAYGKAVKLK